MKEIIKSILIEVMKKLNFLLFLLFANTGFAQSSLQGNASETIITPPLEWQYTLGGYGARMSKPAEAIHDHIKAKALVLDDGN